MESINLFRGYGKVNPHLEDQSPHHQYTSSKRRILIFSVSSILLLTLIIGLALAALIHESNSESEESLYLSSSNPAESIKTVCDMTQYPSSCFSSISSLNSPAKPDPEVIFKLSLQVSISDLKNLSSFLISFNDVSSQAAVKDCVSQFDDSLSRLNDSLSAMEVGPGEKMLTLEKVKDIQTWVSAAMTDQDTCIDGLEEMGSKFLDEIKAKIERSKEFLSISLAIIAKMQALLEKFDLKLH
ncbi:pectinesterase [Salix suchowensis]|uniref:pectinesterase n=1 Tax=Salix koriyanagi TaxID=2511006 RepID=A0A9Q0Q7S7_9ROSI|nr:pectinesterase [Salix suchowensis]KAJ6701671.1 PECTINESTERASE [Salix koriyanagi]